MNRFIAATRNRGKLKEIQDILRDMPVEVISMDEAGVSEDIAETGSTFEENALIKAVEVFRLSGENDIVIADDSGLSVDCLDGAPGIYSARFSGEGATDADRNRKLLSMLEAVPMEKRTAKFVCAIAVMFPDGGNFTVHGECGGYIAFRSEGDSGFGYDPLFYLPEYGKTIAQLSSEEKNRISHRGRALRLMQEELRRRGQPQALVHEV